MGRRGRFTNDRSSHRMCAIKKGVQKIFTKFSRNCLCQSLFFDIAAGLRPHDCFSVTFAKFLRIPFSREHLWTTEQFLENESYLSLCFSVVLASGDCLTALSHIVCRYTTEHSFIPIISSSVSLCLMTFCSRKLPSKVPSDGGKPTKIHSLKHHSKNYFACGAMRFVKIHSQGQMTR